MMTLLVSLGAHRGHLLCAKYVVPQLTGHHMFGLPFVSVFNISRPIYFLRHINKLHQLDQTTCRLFKVGPYTFLWARLDTAEDFVCL